MQSAAHFIQSWPTTNISEVWIGGELQLHQQAPLPASGRYDKYNELPLNNMSNESLGDHQLSSILSSYAERDRERK